jgi:hypothetical protein
MLWHRTLRISDFAPGPGVASYLSDMLGSQHGRWHGGALVVFCFAGLIRGLTSQAGLRSRLTVPEPRHVEPPARPCKVPAHILRFQTFALSTPFAALIPGSKAEHALVHPRACSCFAPELVAMGRRWEAAALARHADIFESMGASSMTLRA